eukprot:175673-Hanusia_phi.AAC.3
MQVIAPVVEDLHILESSTEHRRSDTDPPFFLLLSARHGSRLSLHLQLPHDLKSPSSELDLPSNRVNPPASRPSLLHLLGSSLRKHLWEFHSLKLSHAIYLLLEALQENQIHASAETTFNL